MAQKLVHKVTRDVLRLMKDQDVIIVECKDYYHLQAQMSSAYNLQKMENCKFKCKTSDLLLTITRHDNK